MKALVTGGNGFIGSHLVDALLALNADVVVLDLRDRRFGSVPEGVDFVQGDLCQEYLLRESVVDVDVVFHLAWGSIHETSNRDPVADIEANLVPSVRLLEICCQEKVGRVVFLSSGGTVYGPTRKLPIAVDHPLRPITSYGVTKLAVEKYLEMYSRLRGLEYVVLRPSVPFGPRQNPLSHQGAPTVFLYRVTYDLPITIWGDGEVTRDFFYIEDLVQAMLIAGTHPLGTQRVFNVGGETAVSLNQLLHEIEVIVGKRARVNYAEARSFDIPHVKLDIRLTEEYLDWKPRYTLPEGLMKTWKWLKEAVSKPDDCSES